NCSPLVVEDLVYVVTGNGTDDQGMLPSPKAPSFIAVHKTTGKVEWQNAAPGANILDGQWSNPAFAVVKGQPQAIFPGGDGWHYGGNVMPKPKNGRDVIFGRTLSTCAIYDGLVYIAELDGFVHCLDAKTGQKYWEHDLKAEVWGSAYYADGKVFLGTGDGDLY